MGARQRRIAGRSPPFPLETEKDDDDDGDGKKTGTLCEKSRSVPRLSYGGDTMACCTGDFRQYGTSRTEKRT